MKDTYPKIFLFTCALVFARGSPIEQANPVEIIEKPALATILLTFWLVVICLFAYSLLIPQYKSQMIAVFSIASILVGIFNLLLFMSFMTFTSFAINSVFFGASVFYCLTVPFHLLKENVENFTKSWRDCWEKVRKNAYILVFGANFDYLIATQYI